jgi:tetratricopeptide (TPR) repeat protein/DNA-binding CsgD family transcriptional regulator
LFYKYITFDYHLNKKQRILKTLTAFIFTILFIHGTAVCQYADLNPKELAKKLSDPTDQKNETAISIYNSLSRLDSVKSFDFLDKLGKRSSTTNHYFLARYNCLRAEVTRIFTPSDPVSTSFKKDSIKRKITTLLDEAMRQAYIVDDDHLAAYVSSVYGSIMGNLGNTEKALMYLMYGAELYDKVHLHGEMATYLILGETLWKVREYEKSIYYTKIAIVLITDSHKGSPESRKFSIVMCNNTVGLAFHRMGFYDSAFFYYEKSIKLSSELSDRRAGKVWHCIVSGNMAQIDFAQGKYSLALPLFVTDYQSSKENAFYDDAGNSLQWAAKTNLALGNKAEALQQIRESFTLLKKWPNPANYFQNAYLTASHIFKALGNDDSAYYYSGKYNMLHDSLEKSIYQSSISVSQLRLNNEKDRYNIQQLEQEKTDQLQKRNYIIALILLVAAIVLLLINRQRQKLKHKVQMDLAEKIKIQGEMESARTQLKMFTQNIVEKSNFIEKLESQISNKMATSEEKELIEDLSHQTILTEEDWLNFKMLFEKMHPDFFSKINKQVDNITQAEQRMAALTLLHLTTKQMAAVLGISPNSVIKARQRLRQRLNLQTDQQAEEFINKL